MFLIILFLYSILIISLIVLIWIYTHGDVANFFREPISLTLLGLILIHGFSPPIQYLLDFNRYNDGYPLGAHAYSIFLVLIFVLFMTVFYGRPKGLNYNIITPLQMSSAGKLYLVLFLIIPALAAASIFFTRIFLYGYNYFMLDRIAFEDRYGGLSSMFSKWLYMSFLICAAGYLGSQGRDKQMMRWTAILGLMTAGFFGFTGSRNAVFIAFVVAIGIYLISTQKARISLLKLMFSKYGVIIICLIIGMIILGNIRAVTSKQKYGTNMSEAAIITFNSAFGNHENILWLVDNKFDYQYGKTYVAGLANVYPRAFWRNKPVAGGPTLKNMIIPGSYQVGEAGSSSVTTGMVTESYMNGGLVGVIILAAITGLYLRMFARLRLKCLGPWSTAVYVYTVFTFAFSMTHNEFGGAYTRWIIDFFPIFWPWLILELSQRNVIMVTQDLQQDYADESYEQPVNQYQGNTY